MADETYDVAGCNKTTASVKVGKELVMASGKTLVIKPHAVLNPGTTYTVTVPEGIVSGQEAKSWSFTTKASSTPSNNTITIGTDFYSINGALQYLMSNSATGDWTINVPAGDYHEILGYYQASSPVNLTLAGGYNGEAGDYGANTRVFWNNSQALGNSQRTRQSFIWEGGNLTIKNMTFKNTANRADEGNVNIQAETLYFDCTADLVVYNSSFSSYQDTLLIGNNGGRAWFYKCLVEGDVDFIWGYANVALFENCKIVCLADGIKNDAKIFASRTPSSTTTAKGFVLMNSSIVIQDDCKAAYGRSSGADTQAAVFNNTITTEGDGTLASGLWGSASDTRVYEANGEMAVGYKDYNNTLNGSTVSTSSRTSNTADMSERLYNREYNGRYTILNRVFNSSTLAYETVSSPWDISSYVTEFEADTEDSNENVYLDPVYTKNVVGGNTVQLTPSTTSSSLTYTYDSSDTTLASVDENGLVTTVEKAAGDVKITVTGSNGKTDYAVIKVIPEKIAVTSISIDASSSVDTYALSTVTPAFTPSDATVQGVKWTATGDIRIIDPDTKTAVSELTVDDASSIQIEGITSGGSGTLKAVSVDNESVSASQTVSITTTRDYNAAEAVAVSSKDSSAGFGILNFQGGKTGMWHDLYVYAVYNSTNGKFAASGERVQSRYGTIYVPVTGSAYISVICQKWDDTNLWITDFADAAGNSPEQTEIEGEDTYKYKYTWELDYTNDTSKLVSGETVSALYTAATKDTSRSWTDHEPDTSAKYFAIVVPGKDRYWTHITVTPDSSIEHEAATAELSINDFSSSSVTLDLNGTDSGTYTTTASSTDSTTPVITYASSSESIVSVDSSSGKITAKGLGIATVTATAAHATDSNVTKAAASYTVTVKDTSVEDNYSVNFTQVSGAASTAEYDFGKFKSTGGKYHGSSYGWTWGTDGTLSVTVKGSSTITLSNSYANSDAKITVKSSDTSDTFDSTTLNASSGDHKSFPEELSVSYTAASSDSESTVTFTFGGTVYLSKITVTSASYSKVISSDELLDLRTLFASLPTTGSSSTGSEGKVSYSAMYYKDSTHGANFYKTSSLSFTVSGACTVYVANNQYSTTTFAVSGVDASNNAVSSFSTTTVDAKAAGNTLGSSVTELTSENSASFNYTGMEECTITLSLTDTAKQAYLPAIYVDFK